MSGPEMNGGVVVPETKTQQAAAQIGSDAGRVMGETMGAAAGQAFAKVAEQTVDALKTQTRDAVEQAKVQAAEQVRGLPQNLVTWAREAAVNEPLKAFGYAVGDGVVLGLR